MPLNTPYGKKTVAKPLNHAVKTALYISDSASGKIHTLMMGTVHRKAAAVELSEEGVPERKGIMDLIGTVILMEVSGGQVLVDIPAKEYIDQLHALADSKNGLLFQNKGFQDGKLEPVKSWINHTGTAVQLSEKLWVNVAAARQDQPLVGSGIRHMQGGHRCDA